MKSLIELLSKEDLLESKVADKTTFLSLCDNTKSITAGCLFFALKGAASDGHSFVRQALDLGAHAVVVENPDIYLQSPKSILVTNTRKALALASSRYFNNPSTEMKIVGITGTNGKTTTTYLIKQAWDYLSVPSGLMGTVEWQILNRSFEATSLTTPDPIRLQQGLREMRQANVQHLAMEVSSIALDQGRVLGTQYDVAAFTNFTPDHLDYHQNMDNYFKAKEKLFTELCPRVAILNDDDPAVRETQTASVSQVLRVSFSNPKADVLILLEQISPHGMKLSLDSPWGPVKIHSGLVGQYNAFNIATAATALLSQGFKVHSIEEALSSCAGPPGRMELIRPRPDAPYCFVDYAHSEDALERVLASLDPLRKELGGRILTVFGCGGNRDRIKRPKMAQVAEKWSDIICITSDNPRTEDPESILNEIASGLSRPPDFKSIDRRKSIHRALELSFKADIVLVAGRGHEKFQTWGTDRIPFDDRAVIREYYSKVKLLESATHVLLG